MYEKNLKEDLRLRLTSVDMDFLRKLSEERMVSVSEVIRSIIGEYRRSLQTLDLLQTALDIAKLEKEGQAVHGNTKTNLDNKL